MEKRLGLLLVILIIFTSTFVVSESIADSLHLNIQTINSTDDVVAGTFKFEFNITSDFTCANVLYSNHSTLTTDARGIISYYLENINLNFSDQYWLCYYRDGVLINNSKIARNPYTFKAKNVSAGGIINDSNLDLTGKNITASTGFFSFVGDLVTRVTSLFVQDIDFTGKINGSGNINTTGNVTADYFFGDGSLLTGISSSGDFSFTDFHNSFVLNSSILNNTANIGNLYNETALLFAQVANTTAQQALTINTTANIQNLINGTNINFGDVDFNGGWLSEGVSIIDGNIYATTGYFYNITGLNVNTLNINGSLLPTEGWDNTFDIGRGNLRFKDLYLSGQIYSNGTGDNWFLGDVGIGTNNPTSNLEIFAVRTAVQQSLLQLRTNNGVGSTTGDEVSLDFGWWNTLKTGRISGWVQSSGGSGVGGLKFYTAATSTAYNTIPTLTLKGE